MAMPDSQRYPWKRCLIKNEFDINIYNFETDFFPLGFLYWSGLHISNEGKHVEIIKVKYF